MPTSVNPFQYQGLSWVSHYIKEKVHKDPLCCLIWTWIEKNPLQQFPGDWLWMARRHNPHAAALSILNRITGMPQSVLPWRDNWTRHNFWNHGDNSQYRQLSLGTVLSSPNSLHRLRRTLYPMNVFYTWLRRRFGRKGTDEWAVWRKRWPMKPIGQLAKSPRT